MISIEEMRKAEGHKVKLKVKGAEPFETFIESYEQSETEEEEAMLLYSPRSAVWQSQIESLEIID
ncbi:MAG: hypothetical protein ACOX4R_03530 [Lentihominibacter sp.]|jgi:hypothetical protein